MTTWSFELAYYPRASPLYVARLRYGELLLERGANSATNALMALLQVAGNVEDRATRQGCVAAIRQGLGRESLPPGA